MKTALNTLTIDERSALIALPRELKTDDGRVLRIRTWAPRLEVGAIPFVMVEAILIPASESVHP